MLALVGMPMFFLESSFGQFASLGPVAVWKAVPMLQGVGITMVILITIINISYSSMIGYSLYYLFASFQSPLPWTDCFSWWGADETCSRTPKDPLCNLTLDDGYFEIVNTTWLHVNNETCPNGSEIYVPHQGPSEQYWDKGVLRRTNSIDETGEIVWDLALCLLLAWLIAGAALSKGIKSSGKVVYFTATFPYVVLTILLIRGLTLEGAYKGIEFYIGRQSDFSKLADAEIWKEAATQIFFSISVGWGSLITLSSYNKFHNNCYRDTIIVCVVNCATSVFAGFIIFSTLGHMAHIQDKPVSEVVQSGFSLAFIAYPEALAQLPWAPLWSSLFFFMLITLGLDTQFAGLETIFTTLLDQFPKFLRSKRLYLTAGVCALFYFLGLVYVTQAGIYWLNFVDYFCTGWILITVALLELTGLSWIYGVNRFIKDIEMMIGERTWLFWLWWRACWTFIAPCLLAVILIWSLATFAPPTYGSVQYPVWAIALGWCMIIFCSMWIPIVAIVRVVQAEGATLCQKISAACTSDPGWSSNMEKHKEKRSKNKPDSTEAVNSVLLVIP
ncbi:sodium- and chloride-dependent neutral and basic amino acid transporter B(0+)-like isoform X4 [Scyliorhinus torazame]